MSDSQTTKIAKEVSKDKLTPREISNKNLKPFVKGKSGNPIGRPKDTAIQVEAKKQVKQLLREYEEGLAESLHMISPVIIKEAKKGNMQAIAEVHKVLGAHKKGGDITMIDPQINILIQKANKILPD